MTLELIVLIFLDEKTDSDLLQVVKAMNYEEKSQEKLGKEKKKWEVVLLDIKIYLEAVVIETTWAGVESVEQNIGKGYNPEIAIRIKEYFTC